MSDTQAIADDFTALCKAGQLDEAGEKYWAQNVISLEPMEGDMARAEGIDALRAKGQWWYGAHDVHSVGVTGPSVNGNQFTVGFAMDITVKETGQRMQMEETALYTVADGKITEERFFYNG
jgi:ketosteroid isomerase-like protein